MAKKATFTCKICGGEHSGLICTAFGGPRGIHVVADQPRQRAQNQQMRALLESPALVGKAMGEHVVATFQGPAVIDAVAEPVTDKPKRKAVGKLKAGTKIPDALVTKMRHPVVPASPQKRGKGRPKIYGSAAERQRACRAKKKAAKS